MTGAAPNGIAIIGMACRFPGADTPTEFWKNLRDGVESVTFFSDEELLAAGVAPPLLQHPDYVKASPILRDAEAFDAAFFGYSPKEATIMDPQHRLFLETCWEAFEDAGYDPAAHDGVVGGVFAGAGSTLTSYLLAHHHHPDMQGQTAGVQHINNDKDFLATRVSYKLNLTGPSLTVQTACSTSLVAVHLACQSLLSGECDMALAGASTVRFPHVSGYLAERGSVHSRDGHCRAFDAGGLGTIFGSGVAAVLLKPLAAALEDRDHIYAVIAGTAVTNDGASKISYTAASAVGQARAIVEALETAEVSADSISYVECHATGTAAGDPVEIQALTRAFRLHTRRTEFCAVGSVKTNVGHPEQSAGLAGLIKTALALKHRRIPPTVHFVRPNPSIPFTESPFYVQSTLADWPRGTTPRRAGVNSLGIGGSNAFAVLEEAPDTAVSSRRALAEGPERAPSARLFCLSAKTATALGALAQRVAGHVVTPHDADLDDVCHTANRSRTAHPYRCAVTCATNEELSQKLEAIARRDPRNLAVSPVPARPVAFLFSGQGAQYAGMSAQLYRTMPRYRAVLDECDAALRPHLDRSLVELLCSPDSTVLLNQTRFVQPALFAVEYALAELWRSWGIVPAAVMGHSVGELVAACVAGVLDVKDALSFVAARGTLMDGATGGGMAAVFAGEETVRTALRASESSIEIAALNSPSNTVVTGERGAVVQLCERLNRTGIRSKLLDVSEAFHSALLEPILPTLEQAAEGLHSRPPAIPFISNITGRPHACAPTAAYWRDHARKPVRFSDGVVALRKLGCEVFLEIGPGATAVSLGRETAHDASAVWLTSLNRHESDTRTILESLGRLYMEGHAVDWDGLAAGTDTRRVPLPTYPFERKRFSLAEAIRHPVAGLEAAPATPAATLEVDSAEATDLSRCSYQLAWQQQPAPAQDRPTGEPSAWLIFADSSGVGAGLADAIERRGDTCHVVLPGCGPTSSSRRWNLDPSRKDNFHTLLDAVRAGERRDLRGVIYLWSLDAPAMDETPVADLHRAETSGTRSALYLVQALAATRGYDDSRLWFVTRGGQQVPEAQDRCEPAQALLWGLGRTIALELPRLWGGNVDLAIGCESAAVDAQDLLANILDARGERQMAIRGSRRYVARLTPLADDRARQTPSIVRPDASYLITGGSGMVGLTTARWLVEEKGARSVALLSRQSPTASVEAELSRLEGCGARIRVFKGDVANDSDVRRILEEIRHELPPLKGVVHSAGVLADRILTEMTWETFTRATAPKVIGGWLLHHYLQDEPLDFFVVHSSLLSLTGSAGQANYTAANAFLDALVDYRRAAGRPAIAINWGPWADSGMAASTGSRGQAIWRARGVRFIQPALARRALDHALAGSSGHMTVALCEWEKYATQAGERAFYSHLAASDDVFSVERRRSSIAQTMVAVEDPRRRRAVLLDALCEEVIGELGLDGTVDTRQPLQQLGVDSLMSVNLANRLESVLGVSVPVAMLVRGPSLDDLADELLSAHGTPPHGDPEAARPRQTPAVARGAQGKRQADEWLVIPRPSDAAAVRLFCFNFAGGGASPFLAWTGLLAPWIELIVVEPPGRGSRIHEAPLVRLDAFLDRLMPMMRPYLDRPCALFGHCLGALTLFEAARRLLREGFPDILQLFVSGARAPARVSASGVFEETLLLKLLDDPQYDPLRPVHQQPDETFADVLRQFNIWATDDLLEQRELRGLLLPAIRADFEMAATYKFTPEAPWDLPITCFNGLDDCYVSRDQAMEWNRHTRREFRVHLRNGNHFLVVDDRDFIVSTINAELASAAREHGRRS